MSSFAKFVTNLTTSRCRTNGKDDSFVRMSAILIQFATYTEPRSTKTETVVFVYENMDRNVVLGVSKTIFDSL